MAILCNVIMEMISCHPRRVLLGTSHGSSNAEWEGITLGEFHEVGVMETTLELRVKGMSGDVIGLLFVFGGGREAGGIFT